MSTSGKKRTRSSNFSNDEKLLALNIVNNYIKIIENKKTDTVTWRDKESAWENIADDFNSQSPNNVFRSKETLKKFYENKKRETRKVCAEEKKELYATGGGTTTTKYDATIEIAKSMMNKKTVDGLCNNFDGDRLNNGFKVGTAETDIQNNSKKIIIEDDSTAVNWADYKIKYLQTPLSGELRNELSTYSDHAINTIDIDEEVLNNIVHQPVNIAATSVAATSKNNNNNVPQPSITGYQLSSKDKTREDLPEWKNRRRPRPVLSSSYLSKQYSDLAEVKLELAKLQLQILKDNNEIRTRREEEEHSLKITLLKLEIKIKEKNLTKIDF